MLHKNDILKTIDKMDELSDMLTESFSYVTTFTDAVKKAVNNGQVKLAYEDLVILRVHLDNVVSVCQRMERKAMNAQYDILESLKEVTE